MKRLSLKARRKMEQDAARGKWYNFVELQRVPEFVAWLTDEDHEWMGQSPDVGGTSWRCGTASYAFMTIHLRKDELL